MAMPRGTLRSPLTRAPEHLLPVVLSSMLRFNGWVGQASKYGPVLELVLGPRSQVCCHRPCNVQLLALQPLVGLPSLLASACWAACGARCEA